MPRKPGRKTAAKNVKKAEAAAPAKTSRSSAAELTRLIKQLGVERQHHLDSIAEIDQTFKEFGITAGSVGRKGKGGRRKAAEAAAPAPKKGRRGGRRKGVGKAKAPKAAKAVKAAKAPKPAKSGDRRSPWANKFSITGDALILGFVKDKGGATTEEIRKHWEGSGRRGKAENNLTQLVKTGQLKRTKLEGKPGSTYSIP